MKALIYKEFKLAMHPLCYVFIFAFPLMILIPSYPLAVGFIYVLSCYPILFLGANKGQQSNDLLFSTLLPVRKKDIVMARIITIMIMHFVFAAMCAILAPVSAIIRASIVTESTEATQNLGVAAQNSGFPITGFVTVLAFALIGLALADLIFFPIYYKHGKSIVASTLLMMLGFVFYLGIFTVALPLILDRFDTTRWLFTLFSSMETIWVQFVIV